MSNKKKVKLKLHIQSAQKGVSKGIANGLEVRYLFIRAKLLYNLNAIEVKQLARKVMKQYPDNEEVQKYLQDNQI